MKKGISPLIAAVILIAFVVAIAGIASTFFTGFIKGRASEIEEKGAQAVDCSVADFDIDPDTVITQNSDSPQDNFTEVDLTIRVKGETTLFNWTLTVFNNESETNSTTVNQELNPGESYRFTDESIEAPTPFYPATRVRVSTQECPNLESTANQTGGSWELIYQ